MQRSHFPALALAATTAGVAALGGPARASLTLTADATTAGFQLSTVVDGVPQSGAAGPLGMAFNGSKLIVADAPGNVRVMADVDGQHAGSIPVAQSYGYGNAVGLASVGGSFYMARQTVGDIVQINSDGTYVQEVAPGFGHATGLLGDPFTGHLFSTTYDGGQLWDIDPIAKTHTVFKNVSGDGLSLSANGDTLYAETNEAIVGYNTTTGAEVFNTGAFSDGPDGAAVGTSGSLLGNIFINTNGVNNNNGNLWEVNLATNARTLIATGGSRGDFVTVDTNDGSLLLTQSDSILRLKSNTGNFGAVPEPGSLPLLLTGAMGACGLLRRRRS